MRKPDFCICENKGADQLRNNCEADQRLCFHYSDSTILLLFKSEILSIYPISKTGQFVMDLVGNPAVRFYHVVAHNNNMVSIFFFHSVKRT